MSSSNLFMIDILLLAADFISLFAYVPVLIWVLIKLEMKAQTKT